MNVYSTNQLAEYYGLRPSDVRKLVQRGLLHPLIYGAKHLIFDEEALTRGLSLASDRYWLKTRGKGVWAGPFGRKPEPFYVEDWTRYGLWNSGTPTAATVRASEDEND